MLETLQILDATSQMWAALGPCDLNQFNSGHVKENLRMDHFQRPLVLFANLLPWCPPTTGAHKRKQGKQEKFSKDESDVSIADTDDHDDSDGSEIDGNNEASNSKLLILLEESSQKEVILQKKIAENSTPEAGAAQIETEYVPHFLDHFYVYAWFLVLLEITMCFVPKEKMLAIISDQ